MDKAINFYELKRQLADLGLVRPELVDRLRETVLSDNVRAQIQHRERNDKVTLDCWLDLYRELPEGPVILHSYDTALMDHQSMDTSYRSFQVDTPIDIACQVLAKQLAEHLPDSEAKPWLLNREQAMAYLQTGNAQNIDFFERLNSNNMNTQNLDFLKKTLLNLGFGEKINDLLEKRIEAKEPAFALLTSQNYNQKDIAYALHFKAGNENGMYFLNKFDAGINERPDEKQTFYINKGNGVTAKEAFNLMEGRAVYKQLYNKEGEGYHAWLQLDNDKKNDNGNKELKRFTEKYGFDLEKVLTGKDIKELKNPEAADNLYRSLKKGNVQQITVERNGEDKKYFIAASPQFKTVDLYDHKMKKIKREELLQPAKAQTNSKSQANNKDQSKQQKEELPGKKQTRKNKMHA